MAEILVNPIAATAETAIAGAAIALWLAAAWWAYLDAARRTESTLAAFIAAGWIVLSTPLLLPMSLVICSRHGTAAGGGSPTAAGLALGQRRDISSARPWSYAASRDTLSASS